MSCESYPQSRADSPCRSRLSFKPFKTLDCRPEMLCMSQNIYHRTQLNRRMLAFTRLQCSALMYCTVSCETPLTPDHKDDPPAGNTPRFLACNGESFAIVLTSLLISMGCQLRKSSQAQKTTASVIGRKVPLSSGFVSGFV